MVKRRVPGLAPHLENLEDRTVPAGGNWILDPKLVDLSQVFIHFKTTEPVKMEANAYLQGVDVDTTFDLTPGIYLTKIDTHLDYSSTLDALLKNPSIERIDQNFIDRILLKPNDTRYSEQWGLNNTGQTGGTAGAHISAEKGWDIGTGNKSTIVAVIDSGVDYTHPDLAANMWKNPKEVPGDNIDNDGNGFVDDVYGIAYVDGVLSNDPKDDPEASDGGHGTHCAGIIGAVGNNGKGVSGVNWNTRIMALKTFGPNGTGGQRADTIRLLDYAVKQGAKVVNFSLGGGGGSDGDAFDTAIRNAGKQGVVVVCAAGNGGSDGIGDDNDTTPTYPCGYTAPNIIAVAATDHKDNITSFSNYGVVGVDLGAPGEDILSTLPDGVYGLKSGTSMATPMVVGAVSLVMDVSPNLTVQEYIDRILLNVDPDPSLKGKVKTGGRLNLFKALPKDQIIDFPAISPVIYGVAPVQLNATGGKSGNPIAYSVKSGPGQIVGSTVKILGAGTIVIEANQAGNSTFFDAKPVQQTLLVNQAPLTVTANDGSRTYGSTFSNYSYTFTGFVYGENSSVLSNLGSTNTAIVASPVGVYDIVPAATSTNYKITLVKGKLQVTPAALTMTANDASMSYGASLPNFSASFSGLVAGDTSSSITNQSFGTNATSASTVGTYTITPSGTNPNYSITFVNGKLSITKAIVTLTADDKTKAYGAIVPQLTTTVTGLVNGDTPSIISNLSVSTAVLATTTVGSYPILVNGSLSSSNYSLVLVNGSLKVDPAIVTLKADDKSKAYADDVPPLTFSSSGFVNGDTDALLSGTGVTTTATKSGSVGNYPITPFGVLSSPNYTLKIAEGVLKVTPVALTITAENKNKIYGAGMPTLTTKVTGLVNNDTIAAISGLGADATGNASSPAGTYTINPKGTNSNYTITYVPAKLIIDPAPLVVTANDSSRVYGKANPTFTNSFSGLVNGDTPSSITGITNSTPANEKFAVGKYSIIPTGFTPNYTITFVNGNLTVTPAPLTLTADNKTKVYGTPNPALTSTYSGILSFDNPSQVVTGLTGTFPVTVNEKTGVGTYTIEPTATLISPNYFIDKKVNGQIQVTPASLSIKADNLSKVYGAPMPTLTYTVKGLVNDDSTSLINGLGVQTKAKSFSEVGTYPILASGTTTNPNYTIELVAGVFEITKASLVISAANKSKIYGAPMPELTTELTGLVNFDSAAAITGLGASTKARFWSPAGSYDIVPTGTNPNYEITYVNGSLAINKAQLTIAAKNSSKTYGAPVPDLTPVITGLVNGDTPKTIGDLAVSTLVTSGSPVGTYPVKVIGSNANYEVTRIDGTVIVTPAILTIATEAVSKVYGDPLPKIKTIVSGLVNGDTESQIKDLGATTLALASSKVGTYKTVPTGSINNYLVNLVEGTLKVTKAPLSIVANDLSYTKGIGSLPALTYRLDNLVNGDGPDAIKGTPVLTTTATTRSDFGTYPVNVNAGQVLSDNYELTAKAGTLTISPVSNPVIPVGNRPAIVTVGGNAGFAIYDAGKKLGTINPFPGFTGSIKTAVADIDGDAVMDIVAAAGAGGPSQIKIYTGRSLELIKTLTPFANTFKGGVNVKVADVDGDGNLDIVAVPAGGAAPVVKVLKADGTPIGSFLAFAQNFTKGVNLEVGDLNQDGTSEIIAWPNAGGGPNVKVFNAIGVAQTSFFAYEANFTGGLSLAIGDVTGDGNLEIITGRGNSIRVFDTRGSRLSEWNPYGTTLFPVQVAVANLDGTTQSTIVTALGGTGSAVVKNYTGQGSQIGTATVFPGNFRSGLSLAVVSTNGGKKQELVAAPGAGASPELKRYGTSKLALIDSVFAADPKFRGGLGLS